MNSNLKDLIRVSLAIGQIISKQNVNIPKNSRVLKPSSIQTSPSPVPTSTVNRFLRYGQLATSLAVNSLTNQGTGADILVESLSRMRGAALKLGQMISIQDAVPPEFEKVFRKLRESAQYMPQTQLEEVLIDELGIDWRDTFEEFDMVPFAAASIGQVHFAKFNGNSVAVKVQYPGIGKSINSDLALLKKTLLFSNFLPKGMFIDNLIRVASEELTNELDYCKEKENMENFKSLIDVSRFKVPKCYFATRRLLCTEYVPGVSIEQCPNEWRSKVAHNILELCLKEIFLFKRMQTDPNWSNFLIMDDGRICLLDFGNTRTFSLEFVQDYYNLLSAAINHQRESAIQLSIKLGFLTDRDSTIMTDSHIKALWMLVEPFRVPCYNFATSNVTSEVKKVIPTMAEYRLRPPPDASYSLHRKLSGVFLLCKKLGVTVNCQTIFRNVCAKAGL